MPGGTDPAERRPAMAPTETWDAWDVEHTGTGVRIEVKQSSALQTWSGQSPAKTNPRFDISIREWDWLRCTHGEYHSFRSKGTRFADVLGVRLAREVRPRVRGSSQGLPLGVLRGAGDRTPGRSAVDRTQPVARSCPAVYVPFPGGPGYGSDSGWLIPTEGEHHPRP